VCAKKGILVKSSETLEVASMIDVIVFDKTGTLTLGKLQIDKFFNYSNLSDEELISLVASLEKNSTHPIASAFNNYVNTNKLNLLEVTDFQNLEGLGLKGIIKNKEVYVGNNKLLKKLNIPNNYSKDEENLANNACSIVYVILNGEVIGLIGVKDKIRASAKNAITKLKKIGIEIHELTGDNEKNGKVIANTLGIDNVISNVLPNDKCTYIKNLIKNNKNVMMVGDGINDAPSLAAASIGVSMNGGTDIAADSSDVILMQDNLERIVDLLKISKRTIRNVKQNLFWAFFYNIILIPIAIGFLKPFGIKMNPMMAGFSMIVSSLTVIFNALRLRKDK
jgi:Cu+-exporting ATPase